MLDAQNHTVSWAVPGVAPVVLAPVIKYIYDFDVQLSPVLSKKDNEHIDFNYG